jgi:chorismate-pyruvate lyase
VPQTTVASQVEAALARSGGTVTSFLERLTREPIDADVLGRRSARWQGTFELPVDQGTSLLHRAVFLTGRRTGRRYVYAESTLIAQRLPLSVRSRLESTAEPIGRVLEDHGLRLERQPIDGRPVPGRTGSIVPEEVAVSVYSRRYRMVIDGDVVMLVAEWFLDELFKTLPSPTR